MKQYLYLAGYDASHPIFQHYTRRNNVNYHGQKSMAKKRKIAWEFTFKEWIEWWVNTGNFHLRGVRNNQYQMCRINDMGPYSIDNVYCDLGKNNKKDQQVHYGIQKKKFIFNGVEYNSITEAIKASGISRPTFYRKYINGK